MQNNETTRASFSRSNSNENNFRSLELSHVSDCSDLCSLKNKDFPISDDPTTKTIKCGGVTDIGTAEINVSSAYLSPPSWCQVVQEAKPQCAPIRFFRPYKANE